MRTNFLKPSNPWKTNIYQARSNKTATQAIVVYSPTIPPNECGICNASFSESKSFLGWIKSMAKSYKSMEYKDNNTANIITDGIISINAGETISGCKKCILSASKNLARNNGMNIRINVMSH